MRPHRRLAPPSKDPSTARRIAAAIRRFAQGDGFAATAALIKKNIQQDG
jgi:hypothetical protein